MRVANKGINEVAKAEDPAKNEAEIGHFILLIKVKQSRFNFHIESYQMIKECH